MFRTTRRIVAFSLVSGVSLAAIVGWVTGFYSWAVGSITRGWAELMIWINSPWGFDHLIAAAVGVLLPIGLIFVILLVLMDS